MVDYGDSDYPIFITTGETAGVPSGDKIFLLCPSVRFNNQPLDRVRHYFKGKSRKFPFGKRIQTVNLSNAFLVASNLNIKNVNKLLMESNDYGGERLYFWFLMDSTPTYWEFLMPYTTTNNWANYLYGWISSGPSWEPPTKENRLYKLSLTIEEGWES